MKKILVTLFSVLLINIFFNMTKKNSFDNFNEFNIYLVQNSMDLNFLEYIEYI